MEEAVEAAVEEAVGAGASKALIKADVVSGLSATGRGGGIKTAFGSARDRAEALLREEEALGAGGGAIFPMGPKSPVVAERAERAERLVLASLRSCGLGRGANVWAAGGGDVGGEAKTGSESETFLPSTPICEEKEASSSISAKAALKVSGSKVFEEDLARTGGGALEEERSPCVGEGGEGRDAGSSPASRAARYADSFAFAAILRRIKMEMASSAFCASLFAESLKTNIRVSAFASYSVRALIPRNPLWGHDA